MADLRKVLISDKLAPEGVAILEQAAGIEVEAGDDYLVIRPDGCSIVPARIETYDDHRVAMSFGLLRLLHDGIEIEDPACVAKSFPGYWDELARFVEHHLG